MAGEGRYFVSGARGQRSRIPATIDHAVDSPLCTTLCRAGARVRTVEHLLSALEACGVDNCRIEIGGGDEVFDISDNINSTLVSFELKIKSWNVDDFVPV